jgi:hypothetical protein
MEGFKVTNSNRDEIQVKYVDSIIAHLDFIQIRSLLRDYLHSEKDRYSNEDLADEIRSRDPRICKDVFGRVYRHNKEIEVLS